jgi:hypothetical protein
MRSIVSGLLALTLLPLASVSARAPEVPVPSAASDRYLLIRNPAAPVELDAMASLIGEWAITTETRQQDGTWADSDPARWNFYFILDGHAIQDDWIDLGAPLGDPPVPQRGTNIRVYDPAEGRWEMAWIANNTRSMSTYTATNEADGSVVMRDLWGVPSMRRITFFDMREDRFEWKLEITPDQGETWTEVFRIHGERME